MEQRSLGRTGIQVTVLGFGSSEIGFQGVPLAESAAILNRALDSGLNVIDTAECYPGSEEKIGAAVGHRRGDYSLFTKIGHSRGYGNPDWKEPAILAATIDTSLKRLSTDRLDLVQVHSCSEEDLRSGAVIEVLQRAQEQGKTRFIGYSGDSAAARYAVECGAFDALQTSVSIADQECITLTLPLALKRGMGVIAKRPIANAAWRSGAKPADAYQHAYWDRLQILDYPFLRQPLDQAISKALRFTLAQPGVATAIVGTTKPDRWNQNAALLTEGPLPNSEIESIRARWKEAAGPDWIGQT
jgi:aryl-alcohol dehydrogenase-like predicted oxidoreductase